MDLLSTTEDTAQVKHLQEREDFQKRRRSVGGEDKCKEEKIGIQKDLRMDDFDIYDIDEYTIK